MNKAHKKCPCGATLKPSTEICPACLNTGKADDKWHVYRTLAKDNAHSGTKGGLMEEANSLENK